MKRCKKCGRTKPLSEFYRSQGMADGYRSDCKTCNLAAKKRWYSTNREVVIAKVKRWQQDNKELVNARNAEYRRANPDAIREGHLRRTFGLTIADYDELLARQGGGCAICGRPPKKAALHVDHDHETGVVRGLLCVGCNNALGQFHDDPDLLSRAVDYLTVETWPYIDVTELEAIARARAGGLRGSAV